MCVLASPPPPSSLEPLKDVLLPVGSAIIAVIGTLWQTRNVREKNANDHEAHLLASLQSHIDKENTRLQNRIDRTEAQVAEVKTENRHLFEQNVQLRESLASQKADMKAALADQKAAAGEIIAEMKGRNDKLEEVNNNLTLQNQTLIRRNEELEAIKAQAERLRAQAEEQNRECHKRLAEFKVGAERREIRLEHLEQIIQANGLDTNGKEHG